MDSLLLPLSAGPSLEHYHTEYLQGASEAWLKTGKSDIKTDKNIPQLYLVVTLKEFCKKVNFEKKSADKNMQNSPAYKVLMAVN